MARRQRQRSAADRTMASVLTSLAVASEEVPWSTFGLTTHCSTPQMAVIVSGARHHQPARPRGISRIFRRCSHGDGIQPAPVYALYAGFVRTHRRSACQNDKTAGNTTQRFVRIQSHRVKIRNWLSAKYRFISCSGRLLSVESYPRTAAKFSLLSQLYVFTFTAAV